MKNKLVMVVLVCMMCSLSQGAVIAEYNFGADLAATTEGANVTASDIGLSSGLGILGGRSSTAGGCLYVRCSATGLTDLAGAIADIDYVSFTIDVDAGYTMDLTSLTLEQGYSNNTNYTGKWVTADLLTSVGGFTAADGVSSITSYATTPQSGTAVYYQRWTIDSEISGVDFQGLTGSTEFRFYLTDNTDSPDLIHRFDDIVLNGTVSAIPDPNIVTRTPADGSTNLPLNQTLDWTLLAGGSVEDYVDVYFDPHPEPNLVDTGNFTGTYAPTLDHDTTYYWTIVTYDPNGGTPKANPAQPIWSFTTEVANSLITGDPVGQTVIAGTEATLSVTASNATEYRWYKDGIEIAGSDSSSLVFNVLLADEAEYHCEVYNAANPYPNAHPDAISTGARVMTKRLAGWWKLDGDLTDSVATIEAGATPHNGTAADPNFVTGLVGDNALAFANGEPSEIVSIAGDGFLNFFPQGYTVSCWIKTESNNWSAYVAKVGSDTSGFLSSITAAYGGEGSHSLRTSTSQAMIFSGTVVADGVDWHLVTGTYDPTAGKISVYVDGVFGNSLDAAGDIVGNLAPLVLGNQYPDGSGNNYDGLLDDVKIYSYALSREEVADEYLAVFGGPLCIYPDFIGANLDIAGGPVDGEGNPTPDCQVNLADFAELAGLWLASGLYPAP